MMVFVALLVLWVIANIAIFGWLTGKRTRVLGGGLALFVMSLIPMAYGRWTTPSDWHDYPLMGIYYLPTMLAAFLSLIVIIVGLFLTLRHAMRAWRGAE